MNLNYLIRTTPVGNYLPRNTRACLGSTCRNMRQFQKFTDSSVSKKILKDAESLEKALVVRALLKEFSQDDELMQELAWKAVNFFHYGARQGYTVKWAANFLNVNEKKVNNYGNIAIITMEDILTKKIKKIDRILLTLIKKLRGRNNAQNNTGNTQLREIFGDTPIRFSYQTFKVQSPKIQDEYSLFTLVTNPAKMTYVSAYVSAVNIMKNKKRTIVKKKNVNKTINKKNNVKPRNGVYKIVPLNTLRERKNWLQITR